MSTAAAIQKPHDMQKREAAELFKFTSDKGKNRLEGVLLAQAAVKVKGKDAVQYLLQRPDGSRVKFLQTYDLIEKLRHEDKGHYVTVEYIGNDPEVKGPDGQEMKRFEVWVSASSVMQAQRNDDPHITDEDVPF